MMIYFMPIFMLVLFNNFPSGLVLYWTFSNALGILQQYMLDKNLKGRTAAVPIQVQTSKGKTGKKNRK
jgi:YidC/Oxa1 family membrane protein insertase